jgi:hypothetical protein
MPAVGVFMLVMPVAMRMVVVMFMPVRVTSDFHTAAESTAAIFAHIK